MKSISGFIGGLALSAASLLAVAGCGEAPSEPAVARPAAGAAGKSTPLEPKDEKPEEGKPVVLEVWVVEAKSPVLSTSVDATLAAARGDAGALLLDAAPPSGSGELGERLRGLEKAGRLRILEAPKLLTRIGEASSVQTGLQMPVQTSANNTVTTQFINVSMRLELTTQLTRNGGIGIDYHFAKKTPRFDLRTSGSFPTGSIHTVDTESITVVRSGGTAVFGGVYVEFGERGFENAPEMVVFIRATLVEI